MPLNRGFCTILDHSDLDLVKPYTWWCHESGPNKSYRRVMGRIPGEAGHVYMHRVILAAKPKQLVDHVNGDALDNRRENLRFCNRSQNGANRRQSEKFRGVGWSTAANKWRAYIKIDYRYEHLGCFDTAEDAARAYDRRAVEAWGPYATTNFRLV